MPYKSPKVRRQQITLWAERLDDALASDHQARLFDALFHSKAFAAVLKALDDEQFKETGAPAYPPSFLAMLYIYGQMIGVRSSRRLERACTERIDIMWLMHGLKPDHVTISRFVTSHGPWLRKLFKTTVQAGIEANLITLETVSIDGTFIEANASRRSVKEKSDIEKELAELDEAIEHLQNEYQQADAIENQAAQAGILLSGDSSQADDERLRQMKAKHKRLLKAAETIDARANEPRRKDQPPPKTIASVSDPDCRHTRDKEGRTKPNYNAQVAVDSDSGLVVGALVTDTPNDVDQMTPMLDEVESNTEQAPKQAALDAGYHSARHASTVINHVTTVFVTDPFLKDYRKAADARSILESGGSLSLQQTESLPKTKGCFARACFVYDESRDAYRCPAGELLTAGVRRTGSDKHGPYKTVEYRTSACGQCGFASQCHRSKVGRSITRSEFEAAREKMLLRTLGDEGKAMAVMRASTVEPRIGDVKTKQQLRKFSRRGR